MTEFIKRRRFKLSSVLSLMAGLALSVSGVVLFVLYLYSITGTFLAISESQVEWQRQWQYPWVTVWKGFRIAAAYQNISDDWFLYVINWSHLSFIALALLLTAIAFLWSYRRKFRLSLALCLFGWLAFLLSAQGAEAEPLSGVSRWMSALFPLYLILGGVSENRFVRWMTLVISGGLLVVFTAWWTSGRWIG